MVQQFREARKMPLQLFIFKSSILYTGIKLFCGNLMFVEDFNLLPLRLRCSVITRRAQITEVLAVDNRPLAEVTLRARAPGGHTILVALWLAFLLLLIWGSKVPSYGWTETHYMYTIEKPQRGRAWGHHQLGCISLSQSLSHVATPELLLPLEGWGLQWKESSVLYYFQIKGVIHDCKTFAFPDHASATKLLEDFKGEKGRKQSLRGKKRKANVTTVSALTLIISQPCWYSS